MLAVGLTLGIIGILAIAVIIFFTVRFRRGRSKDSNAELGGGVSGHDLPSHRSFILDRNHFASKITPWNPNDSSSTTHPPNSVFGQLPGANMRVANRNSDGSWAFSPAHHSSPITPPPPTVSRWRTKEMEAYGSSWSSYQKKSRGFDTSFEVGSDSDHSHPNPPPAYHHPRPH